MAKSPYKLPLIGLGAAILLVAGIVYLFMPRHSEGAGAAYDERFPPGSSDINYSIMRAAMGGWWRADFSISEDDFISYAREMDWNLNEVKEPSEFSVGLEPGEFKVRTISDGLFYFSPVADNGGNTSAVYDRAAERAVIRSSSN